MTALQYLGDCKKEGINFLLAMGHVGRASISRGSAALPLPSSSHLTACLR